MATIDVSLEEIPQEEKDFTKRVISFKDKFFLYFNSIIKNEATAADLVQEMLITVHKQYLLGLYVEKGRLSHYLMKIAANALKDYFRKSRLRQDKLTDYKSDVYSNFGWSEPSYDYLTTTIEEKDAASKTDVVDKLLFDKFNCSFLNIDERCILQLRYGCDYSFVRISKLLRIPVTTVAFKYKIAIKKIRIAVNRGVIK